MLLEFIRWPVCAILALSAVLASSAQAQAASPSLDLLWTYAVPAWNFSEGARPGFEIVDVTLASDGRLVLFGREAGAPAIAFGIDENGPRSATGLRLRGSAYRVGAVPDGSVWIAGHANERSYVPGGNITDAYLAHISRDGHVSFERTFSAGLLRLGFRTVGAFTVMQSGAVVAAARDGNRTWVAKVTAAGDLAWEHRLGADKGAAAAVLADNRVVVAMFEAEENQRERSYKDHVSVHVFDEAGRRLADARIRQGLSRSSGSHYGRLAAAGHGEAAYVASSWRDPSSPKPIEVAKVGADGAVLWLTMLADTIFREEGRTALTCQFSLIVLPSGDALITCGLQRRIDLYRLERATGEVARASVSLPTCHEGRPAKLFPFTTTDGTLWLLGTPPGDNAAASCTWLGRVAGW